MILIPNIKDILSILGYIFGKNLLVIMLNKFSTLKVSLSSFFFYYISLFLKFSTFFSGISLCDLCCFESYFQKLYYLCLCYNFYIYVLECRLFFYVFLKKFILINKLKYFAYSISEFFESLWPEREVLEFFGIFFLQLFDCRNLLLQYGDATTPHYNNFYDYNFFNFIYDYLCDIIFKTSAIFK